MSSWFASVGKCKRIDLPEIKGWIEVREELSVGEERAAFAQTIKGQTEVEDGKIRTDYDAEKLSFSLVCAYLVDWSARDENDKSVPCDADHVKGLKSEIYNVIEKAVQAHDAKVRAAKKPKKGRTSVVPISSSVAG